MALVVKHGHPKYMHTHEHLPSPKNSRKASQENSCQEFWVPTWCSRHASWGLGRDGGRAVSYPAHQGRTHYSFRFRGKFWDQAFVHCFSLQSQGQYPSCTRAALTNSRQAQSCSFRDMCARVYVTLWYHCLVSFHCTVTWELVSHSELWPSSLSYCDTEI